MLIGDGGMTEWLQHAQIPALGLYLLALRGAWGYAGRIPPAESGDAALAAQPLPAAAVVIPVAAALVAAAVLAIREKRAGPERNRAAIEKGRLGLHVLASLTAAHFTVQAPYYFGRMSGFVGGIKTLVRFVLG
jgi:hypothetical protein